MLAVGAKVYQAWANTVNAAGGINGHPVKTILVDDQSNPGNSLTDVEKLVNEDHVVALVDESDLDEQEGVFGRRKLSGAPFGGTSEFDPVDPARLPRNAHIALANPRVAGSEAERILRRGYNYADGLLPDGHLDAGLFFAAYQRDPRRQFVPIQHRLAAHDRLNEYIVHTGSAIFAVPPGVRRGGYVGETLFAA